MIKILANDGIHEDGKRKLELAGYSVDTTHIPQDELSVKLSEYDVIIVRSATKVRQDLIAQCPKLKVIARAGVGMDNIDIDYARGQHIHVMNTPTASSRAVAELSFAHILSLSRRLFSANQEMPMSGHSEFKTLKKKYSKQGNEIAEKTLGVIGFGRIGQETASLALALGMKVLPVDPLVEEANVEVKVAGYSGKVEVPLRTVAMDDMLANADYITLHVPFTGKPVLSTDEFSKMKEGAYVINCSRGGTIDEAALMHALNHGTLAGAGLDVFENEPTPRQELLQHPNVSVSPHIGGSTIQAQQKIGLELADQIIAFLGDDK